LPKHRHLGIRRKDFRLSEAKKTGIELAHAAKGKDL
jgi:hypothetical protein